MKAQVTLLITIVFFIVSPASADAGAKNNTICCKMVSRLVHRKTSTRETHEEPYLWFLTRTNFHTITNGTDYTVLEEKCFPKNDSSTEICGCLYGWGGDSCNDPLFCTISQGIQINDSEVPKNKRPLSYPNRDQETAKSRSSDPISQERKNTVVVDHSIERKSFPECNSKCLGEINSTDFNMTESGNMTYYFIPIDSPCNAIADHGVFWTTYIYIVGAVIGLIIVFVAVGCAVYIVRERRRMKNPINNNPNEVEYDDVWQEQFRLTCQSDQCAATADHPVESEYDYVDQEQLRSCCQSDQCIAAARNEHFVR